MNNMYERSSVEEDGFSEVLLLQIMEQFRNVVETGRIELLGVANSCQSGQGAV